MNRRSARWWWGTFGALFAVGSIGWGTFHTTVALAHGIEHEVHRFDAADVQRIVVRTGSGHVTVAAEPTDTIVVNADVHTSIGGNRFHVQLDAGTLELRSTCRWYEVWCAADVTISAPPSVELDLRSDNGNVGVHGSDAPVHAHSHNGRVELIDVGGPIAASTSNGRVTGEALRSTDVEASSRNGSVNLSFTVPVHQVRGSSSNGSVTVRVPDAPGAYRVDASTSNGRRTVEVRTDPAATDSITARSENGDVTVRYGAG